jgi:hypothetical protein
MAKHTTAAELLHLVDFVYDHEYCDGVAKTFRPILLEEDHRHLAKQAFREELHSVEDQQIAAFIHFVDDFVTERRGYLVESLDLSNPYDC